MKRTILILFSTFVINFVYGQVLPLVAEQQFDTTQTTSAYIIPQKMQWWYEARFGMFIHFGSYSYYGHGEWCMFVEDWSKQDYQEKITKNFNPKNFNAKQIVDLAKTAGMKYIIITAKHHEGFCMWKTEVDDFKDYTNTTTFDLYHYLGFERDILMELKNECDKQGIKFGLYYSILDWNHHSQYHKDYWSQLYSMDEKVPFIESEKKQIKELIERYHPSVLWFDGDWCEDKDTANVFNWWTKQDAIDLYDYIMSIDSNIIVNERVKRNLGLGDFMCPEEKIPSKPLVRQWETCQTMNYGWGFDSTKMNSYKRPDTLIHELEAIVSRDGNYLLNIGPQGDGSLSKNDIDNLTAIGKWMNIYGESIYGTTRGPFDEPNWGYYTQKDNKIYCHIIYHPKLYNHVPFIPNIHRIYDLAHPQKNIEYSITPDLKIAIYLSDKLLNKPSVIVIEVEE